MTKWAKEEDAVVGGSSCDISRHSVSSLYLLRVPMLGVEGLGVGMGSTVKEW